MHGIYSYANYLPECLHFTHESGTRKAEARVHARSQQQQPTHTSHTHTHRSKFVWRRRPDSLTHSVEYSTHLFGLSARCCYLFNLKPFDRQRREEFAALGVHLNIMLCKTAGGNWRGREFDVHRR